MKRKHKEALSVSELMAVNSDTILKIKSGDRSLLINNLAKGEKEKGVKDDVKDTAIILIGDIIDTSANSLQEGIYILDQARAYFIGLHSEEE